MSKVIQKLMEPHSIAVIGASTDPKKTSGRPIAYLLKHHFKGKIYPVNPRVQEIAGLKCYPDIRSLPEAPDVAIIMVGTDKVALAVEELAAIGAAAASHGNHVPANGNAGQVLINTGIYGAVPKATASIVGGSKMSYSGGILTIDLT